MKRRTVWTWVEFGIIGLSLLLQLYVSFAPANRLMGWFSNDDAFYYFKVAQNLTAGRGLTFDGLNPTNGFHPLWMLVCIGIFWLARFDLLLPLRLLVIVSAGLGAGTSLLLFRLLRKAIPEEIAVLPAAAILFLPYVHTRIFQGGLESGISAFLIVLLLSLAVARQGKPAALPGAFLLGVVAGLAVLARLDNIFLVLLLGLWYALGFAAPSLRTVVVIDFSLPFLVGVVANFVGLRAGFVSLDGAGGWMLLAGLGYLCLPASLFLFRLYDPVGKTPSLGQAGRLAGAVLAASGLEAAVLFLLDLAGLARFPPLPLLLANAGGIFVGALAGRWLAHFLYRDQQPAEAAGADLRARAFWQTLFGRGMAYFLPLALMIGAYLALNLSYAGTAMPVSGQVKQWWGRLYVGLYGSVMNRDLTVMLGNDAWELALIPLRPITAGLQSISSSGLVPLAVKAAALIALLAVLLVRRKPVSRWLDRLGLLAVFLGLYAQIFNYTAAAYWNVREWYWVGEMVFTLVFAGLLLETVRSLLPRLGPRLWQVLSAFLVIGLAAAFVDMILRQFPYPPGENGDYYMEEVRFLEDNTKPDEMIGMPGGGTTGYFIQDRTIVNLDGLINSHDYFQALKQGGGAVFLDRMGLKYVFISNDALQYPPYKDMFANRLLVINAYQDEVLFRYVQPVQGIP